MFDAQMEGTSNMPSLLTTEEIADLFRVTRRAVYYWRKHGMLPAVRSPGRGIRFRRDDVLKLLETAEAAR